MTQEVRLPPAAAEVDIFSNPESTLGYPDRSHPHPRRAAPRPFSQWSVRYVRGLALGDAVVGAVAVAVPVALSDTLSQSHLTAATLLLVGLVAWPVVVAACRGYETHTIGVGNGELRSVFRAAIAVVVVGAFLAGSFDQSALLKLVVVACPLAFTGSVGVRVGARKLLHRAQRDGRRVRQVAVVGSGRSVRSLTELLSRERHGGMVVMGVFTPRSEWSELADLDVPVLGDLQTVATVVRNLPCDAVAVSSDETTRVQYLRQLSWALEGAGVEMLVDPGLVEVAGPRMHIRPLVGFPLLHVEQPKFAGWQRWVKRAADVAIASAALLVFAPLMVAVAVTVKLGDGGPVLFRQTRVGRAGQDFRMLKFRSMVVDAEQRKIELMARNEGHGALFKLTHDPRVTRVGRLLRSTSIDELPQLVNVIAGSMSVVGPRPHLAAELASMPKEALRRSLVTPGVTGLWQVSGRSDLTAEESIRLDLRYVENWSLSLDLLILWKTISALLTRRGAR